MPKSQANMSFFAAEAKRAAARYDGGRDENLDAIVSIAALIARADGWVQEVERNQLLDFVDHYDLLASFAREDVLVQFEQRVRELRRPNGAYLSFQRLSRFAGQPTADLMLSVGDEIAAADCRIDPREERLLRLFRSRLRGAAA